MAREGEVQSGQGRVLMPAGHSDLELAFLPCRKERFLVFRVISRDLTMVQLFLTLGNWYSVS